MRQQQAQLIPSLLLCGHRHPGRLTPGDAARHTGAAKPLLAAGDASGPHGGLHTSCAQDTPLSQVQGSGKQFLHQVWLRSRTRTPRLPLQGYCTFSGKEGREPVLATCGCGPGPTSGLYACHSQDTQFFQVNGLQEVVLAAGGCSPGPSGGLLLSDYATF